MFRFENRKQGYRRLARLVPSGTGWMLCIPFFGIAVSYVLRF